MTESEKRAPAPLHLRLLGEAGAEASDDALCRSFLRGDDAAFGELVRRHQALVYALVRRYAPRPEDARDLCQRSFLRGFQAARRSLSRLGRAQTIPFKPWLVRIAINLAKNHARQERRWRPAPAQVLDESPVAPTALEGIERADRERLVRAATLTLPKRQREVLTLRIDGDLPFREIAAALGITENNAKVHFHHAVKRLKAAAESESQSEEGA